MELQKLESCEVTKLLIRIISFSLLLLFISFQTVNASWEDTEKELLKSAEKNKEEEKKGFFGSIKSGIDEGKRILKGDPKIEEIFFLESQNIKAEGSLRDFLENRYQFTVSLYNNSSWVITKVEYVLETNGDTYSDTMSCGAINPKQSGSCKGFVNIFKLGPKWDFSLTYFGYSEKK